MELENRKGFLGEVEFEVEYSRWGSITQFWGADFYEYRLQIGYLKADQEGYVDVADPFEHYGNKEYDPWWRKVSLLKKIDSRRYYKYGDYSDPATAVDALLSLAIMEEGE